MAMRMTGYRQSSKSLPRALALGLGSVLLVLTALGAKAIMQGERPAVVSAQSSPGRQPAVDLEHGFVEIARRVGAAVVNINAEQVVHTAADPREELFRRFFGGQGFGRTPRDQTQKSLGSGFIADAAGYVLTNHHVVQSASKIRIKLNDGRLLDAKLVGTDPETDLAVLKVNATNLKAIPLGDSSRMEVGDWV